MRRAYAVERHFRAIVIYYYFSFDDKYDFVLSSEAKLKRFFCTERIKTTQTRCHFHKSLLDEFGRFFSLSLSRKKKTSRVCGYEWPGFEFYFARASFQSQVQSLKKISCYDLGPFDCFLENTRVVSCGSQFNHLDRKKIIHEFILSCDWRKVSSTKAIIRTRHFRNVFRCINIA